MLMWRLSVLYRRSDISGLSHFVPGNMFPLKPYPDDLRNYHSDDYMLYVTKKTFLKKNVFIKINRIDRGQQMS